MSRGGKKKSIPTEYVHTFDLKWYTMSCGTILLVPTSFKIVTNYRISDSQIGPHAHHGGRCLMFLSVRIFNCSSHALMVCLRKFKGLNFLSSNHQIPKNISAKGFDDRICFGFWWKSWSEGLTYILHIEKSVHAWCMHSTYVQYCIYTALLSAQMLAASMAFTVYDAWMKKRRGGGGGGSNYGEILQSKIKYSKKIKIRSHAYKERTMIDFKVLNIRFRDLTTKYTDIGTVSNTVPI